jgi:signal transduction histidine kinase
MSALVERLLAYAHVGAGEIKLSNCDCELILSDVRRALQSQLEDTEAQITSGGLPTVCTDPALMTELLQNLVENSIKYRGAVPPRIHISAAAKPEGWLFTLSDNGIGINAEECARVFDAFYRGAAAASSDGHGLGLATCKRIVDRHGGRIEVHSRPGRGTEFHFLIPYAPAAAKLSPKRSVLKSAADRLNQR